jgi:hypothetical protein
LKKIFLIIIAIFITINAANAQVPGYLGKRFMVGYGLFINTNFDRIYGNADKDHSAFFRFRHNFTMDFVTGRKSVVGVDIDLNNIYYRYNAYEIDTTASFGNRQKEYQEKATIFGIGYGIHYTTYGIFKNNPVAPLGDYLRFKLFFLGYTTNSQEGVYALQGKPELKESQFSTPGISLGYGQTRVLFDAAVLDYGIEWSWLLKNKKYITIGENSKISGTEASALSELFWYYFVNFRVGISGLIF